MLLREILRNLSACLSHGKFDSLRRYTTLNILIPAVQSANGFVRSVDHGDCVNGDSYFLDDVDVDEREDDQLSLMLMTIVHHHVDGGPR